MIYFDNSATTLQKPKSVAEAVFYAINNFGNAGRAYYDNAMSAAREIYNTREELAKLTKTHDPLNIAFTQSATESLNLVINSLIEKDDHILTTVIEHNSVLRPLYLKGVSMDFVDCDLAGNLIFQSFLDKIKDNTRFFICSHGSNLTGNITDVYKFYEVCKQKNITFILDISQTLGITKTYSDMADVLCFTGHKGLFGPQGTGGIICEKNLDFKIVKTGGSGSSSFNKLQSNEMPDVFEAGTLNSHSIYGLKKGIEFVNETGILVIEKKESLLVNSFYEGIKNLDNIKFYGDFERLERLPIVSFNFEHLTSQEVASILWDDHEIAIRGGSHCAPLMHEKFNTVDKGIVRFSFSYFNTIEEIEIAIKALHKISMTSGG